MSRSSIVLVMCLAFGPWPLFGQEQKMILPDITGKTQVVNKGSEIQTSPCSGMIEPSRISENWGVELLNLTAFHHTSPVSKDSFLWLKERTRFFQNEIKARPVENRFSGDSLVPFLHKNFRGNLRGSSVPLDNTLAVSRNGFIVSGINTNVIFSQPDGRVTFSKSLSDFFFLLNLGTRMYDPRAIYDPVENKFIFMCLHGSDPTSTQLCIAFSETEDPNGNWHFYKIDGNPGDNAHWFDYPNIAVSSHDFYMSGLMRNTNGDWQYSVLYQLDKMDGFQGKPLRWKHYNALFNADGAKAFNLVPTPSGWANLVSPGMYFISNEALGGNKYNLYYTDESLHEDPVLFSIQLNGPQTQLAPDGRQKNSPEKLNTFDSRVWSAMYLDGVIHLGSHVHTGTNNVGLFYGRLDIANLQLYSDVLTVDSMDFAFPSFSSLGHTPSSDTMLINYLFSGPGLFPGQQQRICSGRGETFVWSFPSTLKDGATAVSVLDDNRERWGDYTTTSRRFLKERVETWVTGCFGEGGSYGTWLGQYLHNASGPNSLIPDFVADKTTTPKGTPVNFTDISQVQADSFFWKFSGGQPISSTQQNPTVTWQENGVYDVTLIIKKGQSSDSITKIQYIHVRDEESAPIADFSYDRDTIFRNDTIQFFNKSTPNTKLLKWTFTQGAPGASNEENPRVRYPLKGQYTVNLTALNIAGSSTKTVPKAITVLERFAPTASFKSNTRVIMPGDNVQFSDLSSGGPTSWEWFFEGGQPTASTVKNPLINYPQEGIFSVHLKVKNNFGESEIKESGYIVVGQSSVKNFSEFTISKVYPNPVGAGEKISFRVYAGKTSHVLFDVLDHNGKSLKSLWNDRLNAGENLFQFNVTHLSQGHYYLLLRTLEGQHFVMPFCVF